MTTVLRGTPSSEFTRPDGLIHLEVCADSGLPPGVRGAAHVNQGANPPAPSRLQDNSLPTLPPSPARTGAWSGSSPAPSQLRWTKITTASPWTQETAHRQGQTRPPMPCATRPFGSCLRSCKLGPRKSHASAGGFRRLCLGGGKHQGRALGFQRCKPGAHARPALIRTLPFTWIPFCRAVYSNCQSRHGPAQRWQRRASLSHCWLTVAPGQRNSARVHCLVAVGGGPAYVAGHGPRTQWQRGPQRSGHDISKLSSCRLATAVGVPLLRTLPACWQSRATVEHTLSTFSPEEAHMSSNRALALFFVVTLALTPLLQGCQSAPPRLPAAKASPAPTLTAASSATTAPLPSTPTATPTPRTSAADCRNGDSCRGRRARGECPHNHYLRSAHGPQQHGPGIQHQTQGLRASQSGGQPTHLSACRRPQASHQLPGAGGRRQLRQPVG